MLITIAIPTYNNEKTIAKAIQSALCQDYDDMYEILIVNNASKDNTQNVIESFNDEKIRVVVNMETYDMYTNHNICLKEAKGDYVLFCHSDDELLANALTVLSKRIIERGCPPRYIIWGHSVYRDYFKHLVRGNQSVNTMISGEAALKCFLGSGLTPSGTCYSRQTLLDIGGFPISNNRSPEMDWAILIIAVFNLFEFEMVDRLLFKRMAASTAINISKKEWTKIHNDTFDILFAKVSSSQKEVFINEMLKYGPIYTLDALKKYIPYIRYLKYFIIKKIQRQV
jgi:glycosyltransferase involved in cell wall biosynthesis